MDLGVWSDWSAVSGIAVLVLAVGALSHHWNHSESGGKSD